MLLETFLRVQRTWGSLCRHTHQSGFLHIYPGVDPSQQPQCSRPTQPLSKGIGDVATQHALSGVRGRSVFPGRNRTVTCNMFIISLASIVICSTPTRPALGLTQFCYCTSVLTCSTLFSCHCQGGQIWPIMLSWMVTL